MPLKYNNFEYTPDNTKQITFNNNEVLRLDYSEKIYNISATTGTVGQTNVDGIVLYSYSTTIDVGKGRYYIDLVDRTINIYSYNINYNSENGTATIYVYTINPSVNFLANVLVKSYLWIKPFDLTVESDQSISYTITRKKSDYPLANQNSNYVDDGDILFYGDELYIETQSEDDESVMVKPYEENITVTDNLSIKFEAILKHKKEVTTTTGTISTTIDGIVYYPFAGEIELGLECYNISLEGGFNTTINYNSATGYARYRGYGIRANQQLTLTITYWK